MPSVSLQSFLDAHLDQILAPLDAEGLKHPDLITDFRSALADTASKAPPVKQPAFQAALGVCNALANALNERENAAANFQGLNSSKSSASLGVVSKAHHLSRMELHSEARARQAANRTDASFKNSQKSQWVQRATQLRQGIQQLCARERDVERQISAEMQASAVAEARRAAIQRYPDLAVEGSKFNAAFVARYTYYQQQQPGYFQDTAWPLHLADEVAPTIQPK